MVDLPDERALIQTEEAQFKFAVSESMFQKTGKSLNFMLNRTHQEKGWYINGNYSFVSLPFNSVDGFTFFKFDALIVDAFMFVQFAGGGGTTELDIKRATTPGGAFTSIFSTTPKITAAAGNNAWTYVGGVLAGATAPVISTTMVNANDALRCDIITTQTGSTVNGCGLVLIYRPR